jgi:hypothetical protein
MRKALLTLLAVGLLLTGWLQSPDSRRLRAATTQKAPAPPPLQIKVGSIAPDFTLLAFDGKELKKVSLHDFRGKKNVALAFYVFAFTDG